MVTSDDDVLRLGARSPGNRRPRLAAAAAALAVAVIAAGVAWHLAGGGSPAAAPSTSAASSRFAPADTLADMGTRCSAQHGSQLWLGIQLGNTSGSPATIDRVRVELPLGGLRVVSIHRSQCTAQGDRLGGFTLDDREHTWVAALFDVLVGCPKPLPVWFVVEYTLQGQTETLTPSGFADLWRVDYTGCAGSLAPSAAASASAAAAPRPPAECLMTTAIAARLSTAAKSVSRSPTEHANRSGSSEWMSCSLLGACALSRSTGRSAMRGPSQ